VGGIGVKVGGGGVGVRVIGGLLQQRNSYCTDEKSFIALLSQELNPKLAQQPGILKEPAPSHRFAAGFSLNEFPNILVSSLHESQKFISGNGPIQDVTGPRGRGVGAGGGGGGGRHPANPAEST
jgi:hypothetical protein